MCKELYYETEGDCIFGGTGRHCTYCKKSSSYPIDKPQGFNGIANHSNVGLMEGHPLYYDYS